MPPFAKRLVEKALHSHSVQICFTRGDRFCHSFVYHIELIRDNRKEVSEFLAEIIEDVAMEQAIAEGETTELVSCESIFQLLEPKA